jgi:hypothetical protein
LTKGFLVCLTITLSVSELSILAGFKIYTGLISDNRQHNELHSASSPNLKRELTIKDISKTDDTMELSTKPQKTISSTNTQ